MATKYVVTAPYVTLLGDTPDGRRLVGLYRGSPVPDGVPEASLKHHLDAGLIAPVKEAEALLEADAGELPSNTGSVDGEPAPGASVEAPAKSASKADWEAYARSQGATDADLDGATKDSLVTKYGA